MSNDLSVTAKRLPRSLSNRILRFVLLVILMGITFYAALVIWGVPDSWKMWLCRRLAEEEVFVRMKALRIQFPFALVADGLSLFEGPDAKQPLLQADRLRLGWDVRGLLRLSENAGSVHLTGGSITLRQQIPVGATAPCQVICLSNVHAFVTFDANGVLLHRIEATWSGAHFRGDALLEAPPRPPQEPFSLRETSRTLRAALARLPPWVSEFSAQLEQLQFRRAPLVDFHAFFPVAHPERSTAELHVTGFKTIAHGAVFDRWHGRASLTNSVLTIHALSLLQRNGRCIAGGWLSLTNGVADFHVYSTLPLTTWAKFLPTNHVPPNLFECRSRSAFSFELWLGPAPLPNLAEHITGWAAIANTRVRSVFADRIFCHFKKSGPQIHLDHVEMRFPELRARGTAFLDLNNLHYLVQGSAEGNPHNILPWLPSGISNLLSECDGANAFCARGEATGCVTQPPAFSLTMEVTGTNFIFRNAEVSRAYAGIHYSNDLVTLHNLHVVRPEGEARGWMTVDFQSETIRYAATSTISPHATARFLGSNIYAFVQPFRADGPAELASWGVINYDDMDRTDLEAVATLKRFGWDRFIADEIRTRARAKGRSVLFTDTVGLAYKGHIRAQIAVDDIGLTSTPPQYAVSATVEKVNFQRMLQEIFRLTNLPYQGSLSATVTVAGAVGAGKGETAVGSGSIRICEGQLFQLPLLGGLSHFLSRIYPGLGFASQTDLEADFLIRNGAVCSEGLALEGTVLSLLGKGCYRFDGNLDFTVEVKLLRRGYVAYLLRFVTLPVTKLLEFHLGGTPDKPQWRPQNLPQKLFLQFD